MKIKYIQHEVMNDAPFIGALVVANDCTRGCTGCFNQELRNLPSKDMTVEEIISEVRKNPLNSGIILGGLEWTEQFSDLLSLSCHSFAYGLDVIIYTHMNEADFLQEHMSHMIIDYAKMLEGNLYVKFGCYDELKKTEDNIQFGVKLATSNQKIKHYGNN